MTMKLSAVSVVTGTVRRKTFVAREDLLDRMSELAKTQGSSLFDLVNDLFELAIVADNLNFSLKRVVEARKVLEMAKCAGFVLCLERLWYEMADIAYKNDKDDALKSWYNSGVWFASRYVMVGGSFSFAQFRADLLVFTWNAPEFDFKLVGDKVFVKVTSPRFTEAYTFLFASFLVGALGRFGYQLDNKSISRGIIRIDVVRSSVGNGATT